VNMILPPPPILVAAAADDDDGLRGDGIGFVSTVLPLEPCAAPGGVRSKVTLLRLMALSPASADDDDDDGNDDGLRGDGLGFVSTVLPLEPFAAA